MSTGAFYDYFFNPSTDNSVVFRVVSRGIRKIVTSPCGMRQQDYGPGIHCQVRSKIWGVSKVSPEQRRRVQKHKMIYKCIVMILRSLQWIWGETRNIHCRAIVKGMSITGPA